MLPYDRATPTGSFFRDKLDYKKICMVNPLFVELTTCQWHRWRRSGGKGGLRPDDRASLRGNFLAHLMPEYVHMEVHVRLPSNWTVKYEVQVPAYNGDTPRTFGKLLAAAEKLAP